MGYHAGVTLCYGVDVTASIVVNDDGESFAGQLWKTDTWCYCDVYYPADYVDKYGDSDMESSNDGDTKEAYEGPVMYTDCDGYSGRSTQFILSFQDATVTYQGNLKLDELPTVDPKSLEMLQKFCTDHDIQYEPAWFILLPRH